METAKILLVHGECFEMPGYLRIGYGAFADEEKLHEGLAALGEYLKKYDAQMK
jgi:aspartate/methionine/tyrosine aminotransferase